MSTHPVTFLPANNYQVVIDSIALQDGVLHEIESSDPATLIVTAPTGATVSSAHAENGSWVTWSGNSQTFASNGEEVELRFIVSSSGGTTTKRPKVKVRPPIIKPTRPIQL